MSRLSTQLTAVNRTESSSPQTSPVALVWKITGTTCLSKSPASAGTKHFLEATPAKSTQKGLCNRENKCASSGKQRRVHGLTFRCFRDEWYGGRVVRENIGSDKERLHHL